MVHLSSHTLRSIAAAMAALVVFSPLQSSTAQIAKPALSDEKPDKEVIAKSGRVDIQYIEPTNALDRPLFEALKRHRVLEKLQAFFSPLRLPRRLLLKLQGCNGEPGAYYEHDAVTVCVETVYDMVRAAEKRGRRSRIARLDQKTIVIGGFFHVFLHEVSHAVFDQLDIPILGREEDAADQLAAYVVLNLETSDSRKLVTAAIYLFADEAGVLSSRRSMRRMNARSRREDSSDVHSSPAQRLYNMLCLAYGSDKKAYAFVASSGALPRERAEGCDDEYKQAQHAYRSLIVPHIDLELGRTIKQQRWLSLDKE